ncbi:hypothetical protein FKW77_008361 [Venturia effusa]|uniref:Uncharacterized protein n=1 Tax=Venturia effusa TaxID=50376 RepID=A0A517KZX7_9PEZI|nr:hypothetical protein FKW77_008361 [Venturia effusa]
MSTPAAFVFPLDHHLVITTERHVLSCDQSGLHKIFQSGSRGILAAKEARDGSGTLAIADSHVVVLHQVDRGLERSYRLKGTDGQIRLLYFTPDSATLYFTTTLLNAVQSYSLREARLLDPGPTHASGPTVLAISPTSHLLLTASELPPTVYLQNLTLATQPLFLQPRASFSPVTCAAFHPDRRNIFLLAFKDGTLAVYDANQVMRPSGYPTGNSRTEGEEIAIFKSLHKVATHAVRNPAGGLYHDATQGSGLKSAGITGAAFLPGYRSRAVTVGADGKCKIVDFEKNQIVRTWHVRGPATSLAIFAPGQARGAHRTGVQRKPGSISSAASTIFAIGRIDGKVVLFDQSGTRLRDLPVDDAAGRVVDVEWVKGPGPKVLGDSAGVKFTSETWIELFTVGETLRSRKSELSGDSSKFPHGPQESHEENIPFQRSLETDGSTTASHHKPQGLSSGSLQDADTEQSGMDCLSTVKHNQIQGPIHRDLPPISSDDYMDLFSPVKKAQRQRTPPRPSPPKRRTTPRSRPRLSSSTFVYQGSSSPQPNYTTKASPIVPLKTAEQYVPPKRRNIVSKSVHDLYTSPLLRGIKVPASKSRASVAAATPADSSSTSSVNSKILADLRRFGEKGVSGNGKDNRATLAPYMPSQSRKASIQQSSTGGGPNAKLKEFPVTSSPASDAYKQLADAVTEDDIWLTAKSDDDSTPFSSPSDEASQPVIGGHHRKVSWQADPIWEDIEKETIRRPRRGVTQKMTVEIKLAPPRVKTRSAFSEPDERVEKMDFASKVRDYDLPSSPPLTDLEEQSPSPKIQRQPTHRRKSRSAPTTREADRADWAMSGTVRSPRSRLDSAAALPPGFAHSFQGPVPVHRYVPRKASLAFVPSPASSPVKGRSALGVLSGNEAKSGCSHERNRSQGLANAGCDGCEALGDEVLRLKREVASLRQMLKNMDVKVG